MQMYLWPSAGTTVTISGGASLLMTLAEFGPRLNAPTSLSAPLATASPAIACTALPADSLAGAIAIVDRGTCQFVQKAINVQAVRAPAGFEGGWGAAAYGHACVSAANVRRC